MTNSMDMDYPMFCYHCEQTVGEKGVQRWGYVVRPKK